MISKMIIAIGFQQRERTMERNTVNDCLLEGFVQREHHEIPQMVQDLGSLVEHASADLMDIGHGSGYEKGRALAACSAATEYQGSVAGPYRLEGQRYDGVGLGPG